MDSRYQRLKGIEIEIIAKRSKKIKTQVTRESMRSMILFGVLRKNPKKSIVLGTLFKKNTCVRNMTMLRNIGSEKWLVSLEFRCGQN